MAKLVPFKAIRPSRDKAYLVSSKPFYTYKKNLLDAKLEGNTYTFLHVINPEFSADNQTQPNTVERFELVKAKFQEFLNQGIFIQDQKECFYIHRQITPTNTYVGIIAGASVDDYLEGKIKVHENTLTQREEMFKMYLDVCQFNAEPVLLTYPDNKGIDQIIEKYLPTRSEYEFTTTQHIKHDLWVVKDEQDITQITQAFQQIDDIYIADGHHRSASSVLYAKNRRAIEKDAASKFNYFLSYFIAESNLNIIAFNRIVKDLNGLSVAQFLDSLKECCTLEEVDQPYDPDRPHSFSMYLDGKWYALSFKSSLLNGETVIDRLDAHLLSTHILGPILNITDLKTDNRIDFIDGTYGTQGLQRKVDNKEAAVAFGLYPVSIDQLKEIADNKDVMPPKSTYIEPKMRSGLTIYDLKKSST